MKKLPTFNIELDAPTQGQIDEMRSKAVVTARLYAFLALLVFVYVASGLAWVNNSGGLWYGLFLFCLACLVYSIIRMQKQEEHKATLAPAGLGELEQLAEVLKSAASDADRTVIRYADQVRGQGREFVSGECAAILNFYKESYNREREKAIKAKVYGPEKVQP